MVCELRLLKVLFGLEISLSKSLVWFWDQLSKISSFVCEISQLKYPFNWNKVCEYNLWKTHIFIGVLKKKLLGTIICQVVRPNLKKSLVNDIFLLSFYFPLIYFLYAPSFLFISYSFLLSTIMRLKLYLTYKINLMIFYKPNFCN